MRSDAWSRGFESKLWDHNLSLQRCIDRWEQACTSTVLTLIEESLAAAGKLQPCQIGGHPPYAFLTSGCAKEVAENTDGRSVQVKERLTNPIETVLSALRAADCVPRPRGDGWRARVPGREDRHPSLDIDHKSVSVVLRRPLPPMRRSEDSRTTSSTRTARGCSVTSTRCGTASSRTWRMPACTRRRHRLSPGIPRSRSR